MKKQYSYSSKTGVDTVVWCAADSIIISKLLGLEYPSAMEFGFDRIFDIRIDNRRQRNAKLIKTSFGTSSFELQFLLSNGLQISSVWTYFKKYGLWQRDDTVINKSARKIVITGMLSRIVLPLSDYRVQFQKSAWCNENEPCVLESPKELTLFSEGGRTTQKFSPFACIVNEQKKVVSLHVVPQGNWVIKCNRIAKTGRTSMMAVDLGLSDRNLNYVIEPGQKVVLPTILMRSMSVDSLDTAVHNFHEFLHKEHVAKQKPYAPVVYNTWFDRFDNLNVGRLERQLGRAKKLGCEIFVIDAGWYGQSEGNWECQVGDWREKLDGAFGGNMKRFAEKVRKTGLKFGLWVEPERCFRNVKIFKEKPQWFIEGEKGMFYPDLMRREVYDYVSSEISRLIEQYQLAWMKIDFNFSFGIDRYGQEFYGYYDRWFNLIQNLRKTYPRVFFEGCASGGMRCDLKSISCFEGHFLSDNANPVRVAKMYQQALFRLLPGRLIKWLVVREIKCELPIYGLKKCKTSSILTPAGNGAIWNVAETTELDFAARVAMSGIFGVSGDIGSLSSQNVARLKHHIEYYKKWREFLYRSSAYMLSGADNSDWIAFQLTNTRYSESLIFVYRLGGTTERIVLFPKIAANRSGIEVYREYDKYEKVAAAGSKYLVKNGIPVSLKPYEAVVLELRPNKVKKHT